MSMRRAILAAATAAIAVGLALTGCGPDSSPSGGTAPSADGVGPITFAVGSDDAPVFTKLIKPWNEAYPDQQVSLVLLPEAENGQLAQLTANLQAGSSTYDVIAMDVIWTAEFASAGWIIPLESSMFPLGDFLRPAVDTAMYNGHLWAVPYYSNAEVLYYRKDILAKAGKLPPKTWAQLEQQAKTVAPRTGMQGYAEPARPVRGAHRQLRRGAAVGRRLHPLPRRDRGDGELSAGPAGTRLPRGRAARGVDTVRLRAATRRSRPGVTSSRASCSSSTTGRSSTAWRARLAPATRSTARSGSPRCPASTVPGRARSAARTWPSARSPGTRPPPSRSSST